MKTFAHVEQNLNAAGQKHTKKGKEGRVKSEVHERFVRRPLVVEEREGEILELARQVKELQAKLKHLRSLAQKEGDDTILAGNTDDAAEAAEASGALERKGRIFCRL